MLSRVEVLLPGPWWNSLTYACDPDCVLTEGVRVRVPVGKGRRVGFLLKAPLSSAAPPKKLMTIEEILDDEPVLGDDLWDLAGWMGKTFLCGMGEAIQVMCPEPLLKGEALPEGVAFSKSEDFPPDFSRASPAGGVSSETARDGKFQEVSFYHPLDGERFARYRDELSSAAGRTLVLFPETRSASSFFAGLPAAVKKESLLWPDSGGKKLWNAWKTAASGGARAVVGAPGAVFAPLSFDTVVVDDEANPCYIFLRPPRVSARSLAGRRALFRQARLVLGGRMPGAKSYLRSRPRAKPSLLPRRDRFIFVDMRRSVKAEVRGVEGELPLTRALLERTRETLASGRHALWIMDRKGQAGEVCCSDCGASLFCSRCGSIMRSEASGGALRCVRCGAREVLPVHCPACRGALLLGKRPGLEALLPWAARYIPGYAIRLDGAGGNRRPVKRGDPPSLVLGTRKILALCDSADVGLAAWLDLDAEARKAEYNARFQTFSMVWESYWRGHRSAEAVEDPERVVLLQTRRPGGGWLKSFRLGWEYFWESELRERKELGLPPYELLVQVELPEKEDREALTRSLERANLPVTSDGGAASPLWLSVKSTEPLGAALAPRFEIRHSRAGFPAVTVWTE